RPARATPTPRTAPTRCGPRATAAGSPPRSPSPSRNRREQRPRLDLPGGAAAVAVSFPKEEDMALCYPSDTDWGCAFTPEQLATMREDAETLRIMQRAEATAWYTLAALTAYQIGVCPTVVRPCSAGCLPTGSWMEAPVSSSSASMGTLPLRTIGRSFTPHMEGGEWVNSCGCTSGDSCSCGPLSEVILPGPVGDIVSVVINGVELPKTAYRVDNGNRLVRQDGGTWPT